LLTTPEAAGLAEPHDGPFAARPSGRPHRADAVDLVRHDPTPITDHCRGRGGHHGRHAAIPKRQLCSFGREGDFWSDPERQGSFRQGLARLIKGTQAAFKLIRRTDTTRIKPAPRSLSGYCEGGQRAPRARANVAFSCSRGQAWSPATPSRTGSSRLDIPSGNRATKERWTSRGNGGALLITGGEPTVSLLLGYHFRYPGVGKPLARDGAAYSWVPEHLGRWDL